MAPPEVVADPPPPTDAPVTEPIGAPEDRSERIFPVRWRRLGAEGLLAATVAWVWAAIEYRVWDMSPRVPINSTDDARLITNIVRNVADQGWWTTNPDLGYPFGQQLYDFPHWGETWQMAILRVMSLFTKSPGLLMNAYFLAGVGVAALAAYLALRHLRFGVGPALIASSALTWLPFRIGHGEYHLFRTSFWWVPLAFVLVLWMLHWRERFLVDPDPPARESWWRGIVWNLRHNLRRRRVLVGLIMVVVLAGSETMTTAFTLTLLAVTAVIAAVRRRDPATLLAHGLAIAAIGGCCSSSSPPPSASSRATATTSWPGAGRSPSRRGTGSRSAPSSCPTRRTGGPCWADPRPASARPPRSSARAGWPSVCSAPPVSSAPSATPSPAAGAPGGATAPALRPGGAARRHRLIVTSAS